MRKERGEKGVGGRKVGGRCETCECGASVRRRAVRREAGECGASEWREGRRETCKSGASVRRESWKCGSKIASAVRVCGIFIFAISSFPFSNIFGLET